MAKDIPHGTLNGYKNYGCRCDLCRAKNAKSQVVYMLGHPEQREKARQRALRRRGKDPALVPPRPKVLHGSPNGVSSHKRKGQPLCEDCQKYVEAKQLFLAARKAVALRPCGTLAAVRRHYRKKEPIDPICREFINAHARLRRHGGDN